MESSGWLDMNNACSWQGMDAGWADNSGSWSGVNSMAAQAGGCAGGDWGSGAGSGCGGGADWGMSTGWTDSVGYDADKAYEWGIRDNWGIEPPQQPYGNNMMMEDNEFNAMGGGSGGGGGGGGGGMFVDYSGFNNASGYMAVGTGVNGGGGGGVSTGLESDPVDFEFDGLPSGGSAPDGMAGVGPDTADCAGAWCPGGPACCQPAAGGHFPFM